MTGTDPENDSDIDSIIEVLSRKIDLDAAQASFVMTELLQGKLSDPQIASFITLLREKGETSTELASLVHTMWNHCPDIGDVDVSGSIDTCGTGGDNSGTINISTAVSFVVNACGISVAKHGNKAASSKSGAADVLEALGVSTSLKPEQSAQLFNELGYVFLYAPTFHAGMRYAAPVRSALKVRTTFNFIGPLANPYHAPLRMHGVSDPDIVPIYAETLKELGAERAFVFHGHGGLDEITLSGVSSGLLLDHGNITQCDIDPQSLGYAHAETSDLIGGDAQYNANIIREVFNGTRHDAYRDVIALNAAAALFVAESTPLDDAVVRVHAAIDSGGAAQILDAVAQRSQQLAKEM